MCDFMILGYDKDSDIYEPVMRIQYPVYSKYNYRDTVNKAFDRWEHNLCKSITGEPFDWLVVCYTDDNLDYPENILAKIF